MVSIATVAVPAQAWWQARGDSAELRRELDALQASGIGLHRLLLPIMILASTVGVWLFYVQHQFEDVYWESSEDWSYADAALRNETDTVRRAPEGTRNHALNAAAFSLGTLVADEHAVLEPPQRDRRAHVGAVAVGALGAGLALRRRERAPELPR